MPDTFDPYYKWLGIPPEEQPPHCYRLLGLQLYEADGDVIESAASRLLTHVRSKVTGLHAQAAKKLLKEIALAQVTLLEGASKTAYDTKLRKKLAAAAPAESPSQAAIARSSAWPDGTAPQ